MDTLVSRNAMVGLPYMGVARSTVNWMCGLTALRWRWKFSSSVDFIHAFESSTYLNHQRGNRECWQSLDLGVFHYQVGDDYAHRWAHSTAENLVIQSPFIWREAVVQYELHQEGGIGIFCFAVLDIFLIGFSVCVKRRRFFGFGVQCGLRIFRFLASGFRFS